MPRTAHGERGKKKWNEKKKGKKTAFLFTFFGYILSTRSAAFLILLLLLEDPISARRERKRAVRRHTFRYSPGPLPSMAAERSLLIYLRAKSSRLKMKWMCKARGGGRVWPVQTRSDRKKERTYHRTYRTINRRTSKYENSCVQIVVIMTKTKGE